VIDVPMPRVEAAPQGTLALSHAETISASAPTRQRTRASLDNGTDSAEYDRIKRLLFERSQLSDSDLQSAFGFDAAHTRNLLQRLVEDGFAVVEGRGRATRYIARREAAHGYTAE